MRYRVAFELSRGPQYFTEWFDTLPEAETFVTDANQNIGVFPLWIENENGEFV